MVAFCRHFFTSIKWPAVLIPAEQANAGVKETHGKLSDIFESIFKGVVSQTAVRIFVRPFIL